MAITLVDLIGSTAADLKPSDNSFFSLNNLNISYWRYDPATSTNKKAPVIAIHGGPGFPHNYLLPLKLLVCEAGTYT